jgi:hypothetical protein
MVQGIGSGEEPSDGAPGGRAAQKLVEPAQVGPRDVDLRARGGVGRRRRTAARRGFDRRERPRSLDDGLGTPEVIALAGFDRSAHACHRVLAQQLQNPGEPA